MKVETPLTDNDIIKSVRGGDINSFELLVDRYQKGLLNFIFRMIGRYEEALELTQEAFIKAFVTINQYDSQYKFSTWLYKIATNHTIDFLRKHRIETISIDEAGENGHHFQIASRILSPDTVFDAGKLREKIESAILTLPEELRTLIILRHVSFRSYEEMARITGLPVGTVKNRIFRAREMLKEVLKDAR